MLVLDIYMVDISKVSLIWMIIVQLKPQDMTYVLNGMNRAVSNLGMKSYVNKMEVYSINAGKNESIDLDDLYKPLMTKSGVEFRTLGMFRSIDGGNITHRQQVWKKIKRSTAIMKKIGLNGRQIAKVVNSNVKIVTYDSEFVDWKISELDKIDKEITRTVKAGLEGIKAQRITSDFLRINKDNGIIGVESVKDAVLRTGIDYMYKMVNFCNDEEAKSVFHGILSEMRDTTLTSVSLLYPNTLIEAPHPPKAYLTQ
jgi:hypothetical protein